MKGRLPQVLIHIAGCVTFLALPIIFSPDASNLSDLWKYPPALKDFLVYLALLLFFYFNYFILIPKYYFTRKYFAFFIIALLCFTAIVLVPNILIGFHGGPPRAGYEWPANNPMPIPSDRPPREMEHSPMPQGAGYLPAHSPVQHSARGFSPPPSSQYPPGSQASTRDSAAVVAQASPQHPRGTQTPPQAGNYKDHPDNKNSYEHPDNRAGHEPQFYPGFNHQPVSRSILLDVSHQVFLFLAVFFFSLILRISDRWRQKEKEKLHTELSYLKAQINPHFLFNILNTIYSLAVDKSDQTGTAVVKLSQMMRYVISDAGNHLVPLAREIDYLSNYIELQKMRFGDTIPLSFTVTGKATGQLIAPLILISFVENAFKHGVNAAENADIRIAVIIEEKQLHFTAYNNKVTVTEIQDAEGGLGIENTRKRLQLLYPASHTLEIKDEADHFSVSLLLQLT